MTDHGSGEEPLRRGFWRLLLDSLLGALGALGRLLAPVVRWLARFGRWVERLAGRVLAVAGRLTRTRVRWLAWLFAFGVIAAGMDAVFGGGRMLPMEFAGSGDRFAFLLGAVEVDDLRVALILDCLWIVTYVVLLAGTIGHLAAQFRDGDGRSAGWVATARWFALGAFGAGLFDLIENSAMFLLSGGSRSDALAALATIAATFKFTLICAAIAWIVLAFAAWRRSAYGPADPHPRRHPVVAFVLITWLLGFGALLQLGRQLEGMHGDGDGAVGVAELGRSGPGTQQDEIEVWCDWEKAVLETTCLGKQAPAEEDAGGDEADVPAAATDPGGVHQARPAGDVRFASPGQVLSWRLGVEAIVVVPCYAFAFGYVLWLIRRRREPDGARSEWAQGRAVAVLTGGLAALVILNLLEVALTWVSVCLGPNATGAVWRWILTFVGWGWLVLLVVFIVVGAYVAAMALGIIREREPRLAVESTGDAAATGRDRRLDLGERGKRVRAALHALATVRVEAIVILLLALVLLDVIRGAGVDQFPDVVRAWDVRSAIVAGYLTAGLALTLWLTTLVARRAVVADDDGTLRQRPAPNAALRVTVAILVVTGGVIQAVLRWPIRLPIGLGLVIPAAMVLVLVVFETVVWRRDELPSREKWSHRDPVERREHYYFPEWAPRLFGSAVIVILGLGVMRAVVPVVVHKQRDSGAFLWLGLLLAALLLGADLARLRREGDAANRRRRSLLTVLLGSLLVLGPVLAVFWWAAPGAEISPAVLLVIGVLAAYGAIGAYYLMDADYDLIPARHGAAAQFENLAQAIAIGQVVDPVLEGRRAPEGGADPCRERRAPMIWVPLALAAATFLGLWPASADGWVWRAVGGVVIACAVAAAYGWTLSGGLDRNDRDDRMARRAAYAVMAIALGTAAAVAAWTIRLPITAPRAVGTVGILLLALVLLLAIGRAVVYFVENTNPPKLLFFVFKLRRTPVFSLFVAWLVVLILFPSAFTHQAYHAVDLDAASDVPALAAGGDRADVLDPEACALWRADLEAHRGISVDEVTGVPILDPDRLAWEQPATYTEDGTTPRQGYTIEEAFHRWLCANGDAVASGGVVPMVFLSSWGGGIRAATWAALVTDHLFRPGGSDSVLGDPRQIFAMSGISGGALGFLEFAAYQTTLDGTAPLPPISVGAEYEWVDDAAAPQGWIQFALGDDYLSPVAARMMFVDIPLSFVGYTGGVDDRGDMLERAWERSWGTGGDTAFRQGLLQTWLTDLDMPLVIANGTSTVDNCSFNGSVLDESIESQLSTEEYRDEWVDDCTTLRPFEDYDEDEGDEGVARALVGTRDLADFVCDGFDARLSATALMSARFAYVTPSGLVQRSSECSAGRAPIVTALIDGGYHEPSGAPTIFQLWEALEPLVARFNAGGTGTTILPVFVHIENGYATSADPVLSGDPDSEWIVPIANVGAKARLADHLRFRAALAFSGPLTGPDGEVIELESCRVIENDTAQDGTTKVCEPLTSRFAFISTRNHPGVQAPLGWVLSTESFLDLHSQLEVNGDEFEEIRSWTEAARVVAPNGG